MKYNVGDKVRKVIDYFDDGKQCYIKLDDGTEVRYSEMLDFEKEQIKVEKEYNISNLQAGCYLSNGGRDKYICELYNGGCKHLSRCRQIYESEQEK